MYDKREISLKYVYIHGDTMQNKTTYCDKNHKQNHNIMDRKYPTLL